MRILTWNVRRATARSAAWDYLLECAPDLALLQEVSGVPDRVRLRYHCRAAVATGRRGGPQRFETAILTNGPSCTPVDLRVGLAWVDAEIARFAGNLLASDVTVAGAPLAAVSVYSPAWPVDRTRLVGVDVSGVKLTQNRDVWVADLLWAALRTRGLSPTDAWVVGGDFNLSETFDLWRGGPRGNREYLDRMAALGFVECLRSAHGALVPTYRNRDGKTAHQMDHLFVTAPLAARLRACDVGPRDVIFGRGLSDHLPIIADFSPA